MISITFSLNICPKHFTFAWDDDEEAPMDQHHYHERESERVISISEISSLAPTC